MKHHDESAELRLPANLILGRIRREPRFTFPQVLLNALSVVEARAHALDAGAYESDKEALEVVVEITGNLVRDALRAAPLALASYDDERISAPANEHHAEARTPTPTPAASTRGFRVAGVAFVARLDLRAHADRNATLAGADRATIVEACDEAQRAVVRSIRAVARAVREVEALPEDEAQGAADLQRSLRLRGASARLLADVARGTPGIGPRLLLRGTMDAVHRLLEEAGPLLRLADRRAARDLAARAAASLNVAEEATTVAPIRAATQAFAARLLRAANDRADVIEHDRRALALAAVAIAIGEEEDLLRLVGEIEGRDPHLDDLARVPEIVPLETWEMAIDVVRADLSRAAEEARAEPQREAMSGA